MAIINYTDQLKYTGRGYLDAKMMPVNSVDDLKAISLTQRFEGLTITVLNNGNPQDYWLVGGITNKNWVPKTFNNGDGNYVDLKLALEDGFLMLMDGSTQLGEKIDLNSFFPGGQPGNDDLFISSIDYVTENENGEKGIFMCFTYSNEAKKYLNMSQFLQKVYEQGNGIVIDGNVISIDDAIVGKITDLEASVSSLNSDVANLQNEINEKATISMVESVADKLESTNDKIEELNGNVDELYVEILEKANVDHSHEISNVNGLQEILDAKSDSEHTHSEFDDLNGSINNLSQEIENINYEIGNVKSGITENKSSIELLKEKVNALSSAVGGSTPDGYTIGITNDEQKALYVKVSANDGNLLRVEREGDKGLYASIPIFCEDEELD